MAISFFEDNTLYAGATAKEFTDMVIDVVYPMFFEHINELMERIMVLSETSPITKLQAQLTSVTLELHSLRHKEKTELFPLILQLDAEQRQSGTCKPFKETKVHYTNLLAYYQELKKSVVEYPHNELPANGFLKIEQAINSLEKYIIGMQIIKEKHLFAKYRSCTGCKTLGEVA